MSVTWNGGVRPCLGDADLIPVRRQGGLPRPDTGRTMVTWVGHSTFVVQIGGLTILTDPVWSRKIPGVRGRLTPPGVTWSDLPKIDAVVISHNHYDHLDAPTVRRLPRDTPMFVPARLKPWFDRRGFTDVTELDWWESATVGGVTLDFVPAHHWSRRGVFDTCRTLWGGWVIGRSVYFAGDTGYGERLAQIGERYPGLDLALMPVGGYDPHWFAKAAHVNPAEAVRGCLDVGARRMATMHWGTFVLSSEPLMAPVEQARAEWVAHGLAREDLWDLAVGESRAFTPSPTPADNPAVTLADAPGREPAEEQTLVPVPASRREPVREAGRRRDREAARRTAREGATARASAAHREAREAAMSRASTAHRDAREEAATGASAGGGVAREEATASAPAAHQGA
ncbi:MBL fold metallo-hydrolase [Nonomuraea roseoviolacea]|uniref:L-ascorbate metabolism protein UlaG (Beta-lactamase superfamily) n=1 Tax=Nonomuraea roseoviolacea subsp. carminata TaxID=160689 RepID=A0ABT1K3A8_9ACTN|nr:MBL fold metallo-hydrolase [Nonomuraea roseoviolacea]MCP2348483.1 L-ascorbate metabolism protein UlaG (beta-lactamase superfamily) [Nonomuraea roseoviolacea subsp. carminata]